MLIPWYWFIRIGGGALILAVLHVIWTFSHGDEEDMGYNLFIWLVLLFIVWGIMIGINFLAWK